MDIFSTIECTKEAIKRSERVVRQSYNIIDQHLQAMALSREALYFSRERISRSDNALRQDSYPQPKIAPST